MDTLNDYCLSKVFGYLTPLDWVRVSEVCPLWKGVVLYQWKKKGTAIGLGIWFADGERIPAEEAIKSISINEAKEMICQSAKFAKVLKANSADCMARKDENHIRIGQSCYYRVKNFSFHEALTLLVQKATRLTDVHTIDFEQEKLLYQNLFERNPIKKIFTADEAFYKYIPTDAIEELDIYIDHFDYIEPFQVHFPNLQKLKIIVDFSYEDQLLYTLEQILPYVSGIKTLHINHFGTPPLHTFNFDIFEIIFRLTQLEELSIEFWIPEILSWRSFIKNLKTFCPQLKSLNFGDCTFNNSAIQMLMRAFPHLESLSLHPAPDFRPEDIPEMKSLTHCHFCFISVTEVKGNVETAIESMLEKMPKLQRLEMRGLFRSDVPSFAHRAIIASSAQKKDIILSVSDEKDGFFPYSQMKVERKKNDKNAKSSDERETLFLQFEFGALELLFKDIYSFVNKNMKLHDAFVIETD